MIGHIFGSEEIKASEPFFINSRVCIDKRNKEMPKIKTLNLHQKMTIQLWLGVCLAVMGILLLWVSFFVPPLGIIDASVLAAIGEVFTFSGALIGIDYSYKYKTIKYLKDRGEDIDDFDGSRTTEVEETDKL